MPRWAERTITRPGCGGARRSPAPPPGRRRAGGPPRRRRRPSTGRAACPTPPPRRARRAPRARRRGGGKAARHGRERPQAPQVGGRERAGGHPARRQAVGHRGVDRRRVRDALLQHVQAFAQHRELDPVPDEPGHVRRHQRRLAHPVRQVPQRIDHRVVRRRPGDDLHHGRQVGGLQEVEAGEPAGPRERLGQVGDPQAGGVGRHDRAVRQPRLHAAEQLALRVEVLGDRLDDQVRARERVRPDLRGADRRRSPPRATARAAASAARSGDRPATVTRCPAAASATAISGAIAPVPSTTAVMRGCLPPGRVGA